MKKITGLLIGLLLSYSSVQAEDTSFLFNVGVTFGGDAITTDANGNEFGLHEGFTFMFGTDIALTENIVVEILAGYMMGYQNYSNGSASFERIPLEALVVLELGSVRLGGGLTYHTNNSLEVNIDGFLPITGSAKDAIGYVAILEVPTRSNENSSYGFKYTQISYDFGGTQLADGSGISFYGSLKF